MSQLADLKLVSGPSMYRDEDGLLSGYVYVDIAGRDIGSYVEEAKHAGSSGIKLPPGYSVHGAGSMRRCSASRAAADGGSAHAVPHSDAAVPQHEVAGEDVPSSSSLCRSPRSARSGFCTCSDTT